MMNGVEEVFVVTASGSGHLFPCIELCRCLSSKNYRSTLVLPSASSSALSSSQLHHLSAVLEITAPILGGRPTCETGSEMGSELEAHLSARYNGPEPAHLLCAIIDFPMGWTKQIFWKFKIPVISFFTFGACAAAMEWGAWKSRATGVRPGETHLIPGLPEKMNITYQDLVRKPNHPSRAGGGRGPPMPGDQPPWVPLVEGSISLMFNTCDDLERPFIHYLANEMGLPVWGVGPLWPNEFWSFSNKLVHDVEIRQPKHQNSGYNEEQVLLWLDSKPPKSVIYVAFGSQVSPTMKEILQLAKALEEMAYPFIWVVQNGMVSTNSSEENDGLKFKLDELDEKVGERGLIIRGWALQLLILSHPSTGGFLSHCGWNSTLEAIGRGVPILAWPIRGDQIYNAKLVVNHLKIGDMALPNTAIEVVKDDLRDGIEKLMNDEEVKKRAQELCDKFSRGFPKSSQTALTAFEEFVKQRQIN